jgi:pullulanase
LLPFYDFNSIDESLGDSANYNWGYDPINYNVPEGSFSTDPYQATARIKELKTMIAALHQTVFV